MGSDFTDRVVPAWVRRELGDMTGKIEELVSRAYLSGIRDARDAAGTMTTTDYDRGIAMRQSPDRTAGYWEGRKAAADAIQRLYDREFPPQPPGVCGHG